jgi:hypothetical protein
MSENLKYLTLSGPALVEGNLYVQQPFSPTIEGVVETSETELAVVRSMIGLLVRHDQEDLEALQADFAAPRFLRPQRNDWLRQSLARMGKRAAELPKYCEAVCNIAQELEEYPYWLQYINMFNRGYKTDGDPLPQRNLQDPLNRDPSYASWVIKEVPAELRSHLVGLESVLPDSYPSNSLRPNSPRSDQLRRHQTWRIIKASELKPEKRK